MLNMYLMGFNGSAMYMALGSLGFAFSFLFTVFVFGEKMSIVNAFGFLCLVTAIFLSNLHKKTEQKCGSIRLVGIALLASMSLGAMQIFYIFPQKHPLPPLGRTLLILITYLVVWTIVILIRRMFDWPRSLTAYASMASWGVLAIVSYFLLFSSVHAMEPIGRTGIVYPIAGTFQILLFSIYTRVVLKEKLNLFQIAAMALIFAGMFTICT